MTGEDPLDSRGGTPPQQLCTPVQPCPPGELQARLPCLPTPPPQVSVHTVGGGSWSEIVLDTS